MIDAHLMHLFYIYHYQYCWYPISLPMMKLCLPVTVAFLVMYVKRYVQMKCVEKKQPMKPPSVVVSTALSKTVANDFNNQLLDMLIVPPLLKQMNNVSRQKPNVVHLNSDA